MKAFDWGEQKARERRYFAEREQRQQKFYAMESAARVEKIQIMSAAGLACSEADPDYFMFHNPFVWMGSAFHRPWRGIDYNIAKSIFNVDERVHAARKKFVMWCEENDPWPPLASERGCN